MTIKNSSHKDITEIFRLYEFGRNVQKTKGVVLWPEFDKSQIETEILERCQWKIQIANQVACVWATTFDPQIWEDRNIDPSVYIHRIATNSIFKGQNLVGEIVKWAKTYASENGKKYIRMDTVGENRGLIDYYQKWGFEFLGLFKLKNTGYLPAHYHHAPVSLLYLQNVNG